MKTIRFTWDDNKNQINKEKQPKTKQIFTMKKMAGDSMREEYDIKNLNPRKNPYVKKLKKQITINIDNDTIDYFKSESEASGIPYQVLINLYLSDCENNKKKLKMSWQ